MALSTSSVTRLAHGDIQGLPLELQILNIHQLNGDVCGAYIARVILSDGKNYHGGFVIDVAILDLLRINVYAIVRINKLMVLKDSTGKQVLQIVQMELISQENMRIGEPKPCAYQSSEISSSVLTNAASENFFLSSTPQQSASKVGSSCVFQKINPQSKPILIVELSPIHAKQAAIEGRVIRKTEIFNYSNGTGKFFTFDVADLSAEIRCKAFNDVADMFINQVVLGNVYHLSYFIINRANKEYNHLLHKFEINLIKDTVIYEIHNNAYMDVDVSFKFTKISSISLADIGKCFDLFVTIKSVADIDSIFVSKKNCFISQRIITVFDDNNCVDLVFWGDLATNFTGKVNQIMAVKDMVAQNFKGQLRLTSTMMTIVRLQQ